MTQVNRCIVSFAFCRPLSMASSILSIKLNYSSNKNYRHILVVDRARRGSERYEANQETIDLAHRFLEQGLVDELTVRDEPYGTQRNIIDGVTGAARRYDQLFVIEDDLELTHYHRDLSAIFFEYQLSGPVVAFSTYANAIKQTQFSTFLSHRFSSQAWGILADAWFDFDIEYIRKLPVSDALMRDMVRFLGSDMPSLISGFKLGSIDSWAIPWNVHNYLSGKLMAYPSKSYVMERGHRSGATRTGGVRFKSEIATEYLDICRMRPEDDHRVLSAYVDHFSMKNRGLRQIKAKLWQACS